GSGRAERGRGCPGTRGGGSGRLPLAGPVGARGLKLGERAQRGLGLVGACGRLLERERGLIGAAGARERASAPERVGGRQLGRRGGGALPQRGRRFPCLLLLLELA